jgi:hypothetical protein
MLIGMRAWRRSMPPAKRNRAEQWNCAMSRSVGNQSSQVKPHDDERKVRMHRCTGEQSTRGLKGSRSPIQDRTNSKGG